MAEEPQSQQIEEQEPDLSDPDVQPEGKFTQATAPEGEDQQQEDDGDELVPTFGDTDAEEQDTDNATIRHLRKTLKDAQRELAEARTRAPQTGEIEVGEKPSLWDEGIDGDEDKYDAARDAWKARKDAADKRASSALETSEEQQKRLLGRLEQVAQQKATLGRADADDAFETVGVALGEAKIAGILNILDEQTNGAAFVYALSKNPAQLRALAAQTDPVRLVKEVTRLEGQLKMAKKRTAPAIDAPERGSGKLSREPADKKLADLEKEAARNGGDRTKIAAYLHERKQAQK